jgi:hypothetical protein
MTTPHKHDHAAGGHSMPASISRRALVGAAVSGLMLPATAISSLARSTLATQGTATPAASTGGLAIKGMTYETGTHYPALGILTRPNWNSTTVQQDVAAIQEDLGSTAISLFGSEVDRLAEGGAIALDQGLAVWIQPRLTDAEPDALLDHLTEVAREAERLRADSSNVTLNLGVELSLFSTGIIPGATVSRRSMRRLTISLPTTNA